MTTADAATDLDVPAIVPTADDYEAMRELLHREAELPVNACMFEPCLDEYEPVLRLLEKWVPVMRSLELDGRIPASGAVIHALRQTVGEIDGQDPCGEELLRVRAQMASLIERLEQVAA